MTTTQTIVADRALVDGRWAGPVSVDVGDGLVKRISPAPGDTEAVTLTAGMIDLQVNGVGPINLVDADDAGWSAVATTLARHGVTAFCPTAISADLATMAGFVAAVRHARDHLAGRAVAQPGGAHLEGPFLADRRAGAHPRALLRSPTSGDVAGLLRAAGTDGALAMVTLAPELPGALEAIAQLVAAGVRVSIGHTDATADQVGTAAAAGATLVTHLYNAQRPLHHREPGVVGQALVDERLTLGLIADLHHVAPGALRLAFAAAGSRIAVVSDAVTAADQTAPPRLADGTLAGAVAVLDESVRNLIGLGLDPALVLRAVTATPARALGRADIGQVRVGCRADLVAWTADWRVARVWVGGRVVG